MKLHVWATPPQDTHIRAPTNRGEKQTHRFHNARCYAMMWTLLAKSFEVTVLLQLIDMLRNTTKLILTTRATRRIVPISHGTGDFIP